MSVPASNRRKHSMQSGWRSLDTTREELCLDFTLPTGQSFRWRATGHGQYEGVIGSRAVGLLDVLLLRLY